MTEGGGPATNVWQLQSYTFTASQTITPLVLNASGNAGYLTAFTGAEVLTFNTNALLDDFTLTEMPGNLNYQPEQDMSALNNTPANGTVVLMTSACGRWKFRMTAPGPPTTPRC